MSRDELRAGAMAIVPMLIGVIPFGLVAGVTPVAGGLGAGAAVGFSTVVFAGASQLAAIDVLTDGGTAVVVHRRGTGLCHQVRGREVGRHDGVPRVEVHVADRAERIDAGVVDEDVDGAEVRDGRADEASRRVGHRQIAAVALGAAAPLHDAIDDAGRALAVGVEVHHDGGPGFGQAFGDRGTDARAGARHDGDAGAQVEQAADG